MLFSSTVIFNFEVIIHSENIKKGYDVHVLESIQEIHLGQNIYIFFI